MVIDKLSYNDIFSGKAREILNYEQPGVFQFRPSLLAERTENMSNKRGVARLPQCHHTSCVS